MDYTSNFGVNKHPDDTNYEFLVDLYGPSGGRNLRQVQSHVRLTSRDIPTSIRMKMSVAVSKLEKQANAPNPEDGWRLLHRTERGLEQELDLGEGFSVRVHMLLA